MFERRFPGEMLGDETLTRCLEPERIAAIRAAVRSPGVDHDGIRVQYRADMSRLDRPADLVFSQAVMEHVDDFGTEYRRMADALAPRGVISHQIDFKSHHFARDWNGHWALAEWQWGIIRGRRRYAINRAPLHRHLEAMRAAGFEIAGVQRITRPSRLGRDRLQPSFAAMPADDLTTSSALVQAVKR